MEGTRHWSDQDSQPYSSHRGEEQESVGGAAQLRAGQSWGQTPRVQIPALTPAS